MGSISFNGLESGEFETLNSRQDSVVKSKVNGTTVEPSLLLDF